MSDLDPIRSELEARAKAKRGLIGTRGLVIVGVLVVVLAVLIAKSALLDQPLTKRCEVKSWAWVEGYNRIIGTTNCSRWTGSGFLPPSIGIRAYDRDGQFVGIANCFLSSSGSFNCPLNHPNPPPIVKIISFISE